MDAKRGAVSSVECLEIVPEHRVRVVSGLRLHVTAVHIGARVEPLDVVAGCHWYLPHTRVRPRRARMDVTLTGPAEVKG